jgi:prepilin-type N-terminal cleavage/methylation domain-containing protein
MEAKYHRLRTQRSPQSGVTLIETVIALAILLIVATGIMSVALVGIMTTENQGHLAARSAEYAQDKMEQLISLSYADTLTDTTAFPATCCGGTGLTIGGSSDPNNPVLAPGTGGCPNTATTCFVDYLDATGNPMALGAGNSAPAGWYYIRVWQISNPAGTNNMKQITVTAKVAFNVGSRGSGLPTQATLTSLKTSPY